MNFIIARFKSKCAETGTTVQKNEGCLYDRTTKKVYCKDSTKYKNELESSFLASHIEAQENAYFDNFCQANNI